MYFPPLVWEKIQYYVWTSTYNDVLKKLPKITSKSPIRSISNKYYPQHTGWITDKDKIKQEIENDKYKFYIRLIKKETVLPFPPEMWRLHHIQDWDFPPHRIITSYYLGEYYDKNKQIERKNKRDCPPHWPSYELEFI